MSAAEERNHEIDWAAVRADFPVLDQQVGDNPLAYLDSAASTQLPRQVVKRMVAHQEHDHANIHRGVHALSQRSTDAFEEVRRKVQAFLNAPEERECIFVRGATEGINLVMNGLGRKFFSEGDNVVVTAMEHHANIVPWQMLRDEKGIELRTIPIHDDGTLDYDAIPGLIDENTRLVGCIHVSNALGTINDVKRVARTVKGVRDDIPVLVDGCQAVLHMPIDVQDLGIDFYAFSAHKMCGPTGIGVLWGRAELLERMNPFMGGGDMILSVTWEKTDYNTIPHKFEAGTPAILPVIGFGAAIDYITGIGQDAIGAREHELLDYATDKIRAIDGVTILGPEDTSQKTGVLSMHFENAHPHDVGTILDSHGVAIRAGHHCTQPLMKRLGVPATARASIAFYNTEEEIDALVAAIAEVKEIFG